MPTIEYNSNTGVKLKKGESFIDASGKKVTQGQDYNSVYSAPKTTSSIPSSSSSGGSSSGSTVLKIGSTGDAVKKLQQSLGITADGVFGPQTQAAVIAYQKNNGLTVDGIVGKQTLGSLSGNNSGSFLTKSDPNDPLAGGASGRFLDLTPEEAAARAAADEEAISYGVPLSESGNFHSERDYVIPDGAYKGLTKAQAQKLKATQGLQTSALTSFAFTPEALAGAKKVFENFNLKLKDTMNDSWLSNGTKQDKTKGLLESTANEFAKLFQTPEQFNDAYNTNADFKNTVDVFKAQGGDPNSITARISAPVTAADAGQQSLQDYLSVDLTNATPEEKLAYESLIPEQEIAQQQIADLASIPKQYRDLYFGTPETIGVLQEKKIQAEEAIKILEVKAKNDQKDLRAQARYAVEKNNHELDRASAEIEENRLQAKNYMTGMLAKLGALNTTGAAPLAIATLEQKYQKQSADLKSKVEFANREIDIQLHDKLNDIETNRDDDILKVQSDLTLDKEEVLKEIMKIEQNSNKDITKITADYAKDLRTQTEKYTKEAKAAAQKYLTTQESLLRKYNPGALLTKYGIKAAPGKAPGTTPSSGFSTYGGIKVPKSEVSSISMVIDKSRGPDGYVDPAVYQSEFQKWTAKGRTANSFTLAFPPKKYVNPENNQLPMYLRSTTAKPKKSGTNIDDI